MMHNCIVHVMRQNLSALNALHLASCFCALQQLKYKGGLSQFYADDPIQLSSTTDSNGGVLLQRHRNFCIDVIDQLLKAAVQITKKGFVFQGSDFLLCTCFANMSILQ